EMRIDCRPEINSRAVAAGLHGQAPSQWQERHKQRDQPGLVAKCPPALQLSRQIQGRIEAGMGQRERQVAQRRALAAARLAQQYKARASGDSFRYELRAVEKKVICSGGVLFQLFCREILEISTYSTIR